MVTREFFEERIERIPFSGCWIWMKCLDGVGYGSFRNANKEGTKRAHREAYKAYVGEIPDGMFVCHTCDIRACCNPQHLFVGTRQQNIKDAVNKGRLKGITRNRPSGLIYKKRKTND